MSKTISAIMMSLLVLGTLALAFNIQSVKVDGGAIHVRADGSMYQQTASVQEAQADWWPMFHHDLTHTGDSLSAVPDTNATLWSFSTGGSVCSSPTVVGGVVYVGSWNNNIYALNAYSGVRIWNYTTGDSIVFSSAAVADGVVYVGSGDGDIYALNASTGALVWNCKIGDLVWSSPAVANGLVYVGSGSSNVDALNASSGAVVWSYDTGDEVVSSPALDNGVVFIGSLNGNVYALNAADGACLWSYQTGSYVCSSPAVASGVVYVSTDGSGNIVKDSDTYALNASTGSLLWSYATGGFSSPAVANGLVYMGGSDERLYALNATTGACVWSYMTGEASSPAVAGGLVFVGDANYARVYALDAFTGALVWSYQTGGAVGSSPAVSGGVVFIGSGDGNVYAFGPPPLSVSVSPGSVVMDVGESQLFNSSVEAGASPYTYQWYLNGAPVSGAVNPTWTFTPTSTGSYTVYVEVTDASSAVATSNTVNASAGEPVYSVEPQNITMGPQLVVGENFTVVVRLCNVTTANVPAGVEGVEIHLTWNNTLIEPVSFVNDIGVSGVGPLVGSGILYGINPGFYDSADNLIAAPPYTEATNFNVAAASGAGPWWGNGTVVEITFQVIYQPNASQPAATCALSLAYTDLADTNAVIVAHGIQNGYYTVLPDPFMKQYSAVPEFSSAFILPLLIAATLVVVIVHRRKRSSSDTK